MFKGKIHPCGVYSMAVKANSILCVQCGRCIHCRCVRVKRVTQCFLEVSLAGNVKGILERHGCRKKG